jgi:hypothetical protein
MELRRSAAPSPGYAVPCTAPTTDKGLRMRHTPSSWRWGEQSSRRKHSLEEGEGFTELRERRPRRLPLQPITIDGLVTVSLTRWQLVSGAPDPLEVHDWIHARISPTTVIEHQRVGPLVMHTVPSEPHTSHDFRPAHTTTPTEAQRFALGNPLHAGTVLERRSPVAALEQRDERLRRVSALRRSVKAL